MLVIYFSNVIDWRIAQPNAQVSCRQQGLPQSVEYCPWSCQGSSARVYAIQRFHAWAARMLSVWKKCVTLPPRLHPPNGRPYGTVPARRIHRGIWSQLLRRWL